MMKSDWVIQVLNDLRDFAELNGMEELAEKLGETVPLAQTSVDRLDLADCGFAVTRHGVPSRSIGH